MNTPCPMNLSKPCAFVALLFVLSPFVCRVVAQDDEPTTTPERFVSEEKGIALTLPDASWELKDQSQGPVTVLIFSPRANISLRCTVLVLPAGFLPEGLLTREAQIKAGLGDKFTRDSYEEVEFAGRDANRLDYSIPGGITREWGFKDGESFVVFQVAGTEADWEDDKLVEQLEAIPGTFEYKGSEVSAPAIEADASTPDEVRARRASNEPQARNFALTHHQLQVDIDPVAQSLRAVDTLTVVALADDVTEIKLYLSLVEIEDVSAEAELTWEMNPLKGREAESVRELTITLADPMQKDEVRQITVQTACEDYLEEVDQQLVVEVAVVGQVREESTYSTHVLYYPIDEFNDATAAISLTVPDEYTAITGGELVDTTSEDGRTTYRYENRKRLKRLLPFGFAAAKYISQTGTSAGGVELTVYAYPGEERLAEQRVQVLVESANLFEMMMGPLPWKQVRLAHVTPIRKETGVSLPGLIVISDGFFTDIEDVDMSDGNISDPTVLSLLVVADELSHQWNIYSASLPNELGEGVSTFTNMLLIESRHGPEAYRKGIQFCANAYKQSTQLDRDVAIADPNVYGTTAYRGIVFCKTPAVLELLRRELGDEAFFAAWRLAFEEFDESVDGFEVLKQAVNETTGEDYHWFFDQWFFQAGWPQVQVAFKTSGDKTAVEITQSGSPISYRLEGTLTLMGAQGESHERLVELENAKEEFDFECDFEVVEVEFKPVDPFLTEVIGDSASESRE